MATIRDVAAELRPGVVVFGRVKGYPWWPALVCAEGASSQWLMTTAAASAGPAPAPGVPVVWCQFFNDRSGAWLRGADIRLFDDFNREECMAFTRRNAKHRKHLPRLEEALRRAEAEASRGAAPFDPPEEDAPSSFTPWAKAAAVAAVAAAAAAPPPPPLLPAPKPVAAPSRRFASSAHRPPPHLAPSASAVPAVAEAVEARGDVRAPSPQSQAPKRPRRSSGRLEAEAAAAAAAAMAAAANSPATTFPVATSPAKTTPAATTPATTAAASPPASAASTPASAAAGIIAAAAAHDGASASDTAAAVDRPRRKRVKSTRYDGFENPFDAPRRQSSSARASPSPSPSPSPPPSQASPNGMPVATANANANASAPSSPRQRPQPPPRAPTPPVFNPKVKAEPGARKRVVQNGVVQPSSKDRAIAAADASGRRVSARQSLRAASSINSVVSSAAPTAVARPASTPPCGSSVPPETTAAAGDTVTRREAPVVACVGLRARAASTGTGCRKRDFGALDETPTPAGTATPTPSLDPDRKPKAEVVMKPAPTVRQVVSVEPYAHKSFAVRPGCKSRNGRPLVPGGTTYGTDTDSESDAVLRPVAGSLEYRADTQMEKVFGPSSGRPEKARLSAGADACAGMEAGGDVLRLLLQRVAHLESDVKALKARAAVEEQASLGEDATAAGLKAAVEALAAASVSFARKRDFDTGVIDRALDCLWPDGSLPLVGADGELLRALARSLVMSSCKQHIAAGEMMLARRTDTAKATGTESDAVREKASDAVREKASDVPMPSRGSRPC